MTTAEWPQLRPLNLGFRALRWPLAAETLRAEIVRYDAGDSAELARRVRAEADLERAAEAWAALHTAVLEATAGLARDVEAERRALAEYLAWCARGAARELGRLEADLARVRGERDRAKTQRDRVVADLAERSGWRGLTSLRLLRRARRLAARARR